MLYKIRMSLFNCESATYSAEIKLDIDVSYIKSMLKLEGSDFHLQLMDGGVTVL